MARRKQQRGFTLVELLVVISIIGMLMALLLPAVQAAREAGRNNTCKSNLHNLALAMLNYEQSKKAYPGYANSVGYSLNPPQGITVSYIFQVLPNLEHSDLYRLLTDPTATSQTAQNVRLNQLTTNRLEFLVCPSNPADSNDAPLSYVVNAGEELTNTPNPTLSPKEIAASGVCHNQVPEQYQSVTPAIPVVKVSQDYVSSHDGTTNTIMLTENLQAKSWMIQHPSNGNESAEIAEGKRWTGAVWWGDNLPQNSNGVDPTNKTDPPPPPATSDNPPMDPRINSSKSSGPSPAQSPGTKTQFYHSRPSSNHSGTINFAFCDGNVRAISEEIGYNVYRQLMTPNNGGTRAPLVYILNGADF